MTATCGACNAANNPVAAKFCATCGAAMAAEKPKPWDIGDALRPITSVQHARSLLRAGVIMAFAAAALVVGVWFFDRLNKLEPGALDTSPLLPVAAALFVACGVGLLRRSAMAAVMGLVVLAGLVGSDVTVGDRLLLNLDGPSLYGWIVVLAIGAGLVSGYRGARALASR